MWSLIKTLLVVMAVAVVAVVAYEWSQRSSTTLTELLPEARQTAGTADAPAPFEPPAAPSAEPDATPIEHPVQPADEYTSLPLLDGSDSEFIKGLSAVIEPAALERYGVLQGMIRRLVVAIDNLPNGKLAMKQRPLQAVPGALAVAGEDEALVLDPQNFARYAPLLTVAEQIDLPGLAALYRRFYPLFQQAYEELGYPDAYFNDRLIAVIDHLLAAPPAPAVISLKQPNVLYLFADPALEARSPGEKILLRIGPDNAQRVQVLLRAFRAQLAESAR